MRVEDILRPLVKEGRAKGICLPWNWKTCRRSMLFVLNHHKRSDHLTMELDQVRFLVCMKIISSVVFHSLSNFQHS